jgi:fumarate reductase flavoprotein subunit
VPIPGLYAAGEASGGVHGTGRISDTSISDCCVFGIVAAEHALKQS